MQYKAEETQKIIETGVGEFFRGVFRLKEDGFHQEAYDAMGVLLTMLQQDRQHLRSTQSIEI